MAEENFKVGWLVVLFDLPVGTPSQRSAATRFRLDLLKDGFQMIQFSVYARPCVSWSRVQTHSRRLRRLVPPEGSVMALFVTRAQWERAYLIRGKPARAAKPPGFPTQMLLW